jgi:hypothetical protein
MSPGFDSTNAGNILTNRTYKSRFYAPDYAANMTLQLQRRRQCVRKLIAILRFPAAPHVDTIVKIRQLR